MPDPSPSIVPDLVCAVICNFNGAKHLDDCLQSLKQQTYPHLEIIVSDNGSTDASAAICASYGVRFENSGANNGLAWAYNSGVAKSRGEFAFVANNDMWFAPDCIEKLVAAMKSQGPDCFAADPLQYNWGKTEIIHWRSVFRPLAKAREIVNTAFSFFPAVAPIQIPCEKPEPAYMASAGAMLVRRRMFDQLGGFDQTFFIDWEDVDLCWRANRRGWTSVFVPDAWLRHKWQATTGSNSRQSGKITPLGYRFAISQQYNIMRFALKNHDPFNALVFVFLRLAANLVYPFRGKSYYARAGVRAFLKIIRTWPEIFRQRREIAKGAVVPNQDIFRRFVVAKVANPQAIGEAGR